MSVLTEAEKSRLKRLRQTPEQKAHNRKVYLRWFATNRKLIAEKRRLRKIKDPEGHAKALELRRQKDRANWTPEKWMAFRKYQNLRYANRTLAKKQRDKSYRETRYAKQRLQITQEARKRWKDDPTWRQKRTLVAKNYYSNNRAKVQAQVKRYAIRNRARLRAIKAKYRALKRAATINLQGIREFMSSVRSKPTAFCYYCKAKVPSETVHFDHIVALSIGGAHSVENLCVACSHCNLSKGAKPLLEWAATKSTQQLLNL